eukprot:4084840-Pleurochrysis_carterae.AAC.1
MYKCGGRHKLGERQETAPRCKTQREYEVEWDAVAMNKTRCARGERSGARGCRTTERAFLHVTSRKAQGSGCM